MGAFGVVVMQLGIEVGLERFDALVEVLPHLDAEELVEHGAVEALDEAVGLGRSDPGTTMLDAVEVQVELVVGPLGTAELGSRLLLSDFVAVRPMTASSPCRK